MLKSSNYKTKPIKQIAGLPYVRVARLSIETRGFPSLPFDRFGFILFRILFPRTNYILKDNHRSREQRGITC